MKKLKYPGVIEAKAEQAKIIQQKEKELCFDIAPDFIAGAPNYEKFDGWEPERVLSWLNID